MTLIVHCNHQKRLAQHPVRLAQVNQEKDCAVKSPEKIAATSSSSKNNKPNYKENLTYDRGFMEEETLLDELFAGSMGKYLYKLKVQG